MPYAKWIRCFLAALIDRNVMARVVSKVDLAWPRNLLLGIQEHFFPLGDPPRSARNREQDGKHGHRETHRLINQAGVEIHVGIELALDEVFVLESDSLAFESDFEERVLAHKIKNFVSNAFDDARARIVMFVNAMTEAHELDFAGFDALDEIRNFLDGADLLQHVQDFFVGAAVERSEEHTSELQSPCNLVCRLLLEKKKKRNNRDRMRKQIQQTPRNQVLRRTVSS